MNQVKQEKKEKRGKKSHSQLGNVTNENGNVAEDKKFEDCGGRSCQATVQSLLRFFSVTAISFSLFNKHFAFEKQNLKQWNTKGIVLHQDVIWSS